MRALSPSVPLADVPAPTTPVVGRIGWACVLMLGARLVFALLAQGLTAGIIALMGHADPWKASADWLPVWGSLVDVGCLVAMALLARREGLQFRQLLPRFRFRTDALTGLGYAAILLVVGGAGGSAIGFAIYGAPPPNPMSPMPAWGMVYGVLLWPLLWGFTEELTYNGYLVPRLEALTGKTWLAFVLVVLMWAVQHVAMPLRLDADFLLYRALSPLPAVSAATLLFLRYRRFGALMFAHALVDSLSVLLGQLAPH